MMQTEIITFSTCALDVRLLNARNRFSFSELCDANRVHDESSIPHSAHAQALNDGTN